MLAGGAGAVWELLFWAAQVRGDPLGPIPSVPIPAALKEWLRPAPWSCAGGIPEPRSLGGGCGDLPWDTRREGTFWGPAGDPQSSERPTKQLGSLLLPCNGWDE